MRLFSRSKPKIKVQTSRRDSYSGWLKCTSCNELIHGNELESHLNCCPKCDYHYRLSAPQRVKLIADGGSFVPLFDEIETTDPLEFSDEESYPERLKRAKEKTGLAEAVMTGLARLNNHPIALAIMDFGFMGGSMGSVVGERITRLIERGISDRLPLIFFITSGGARMQESILSLMQMAKTAAALTKYHKESLPYIPVLTNPTTGGVTASFAMLGDIILAEPGGLIGFAGPRVIEKTIGQKLPPEAQKSEFLLKHGMIDCIVRRPELKNQLSSLLERLL